MVEPLHIGIIGLGAISAVHIRTYRANPDVRIHSVAENNPDLLKKNSGIVPDGRAYEDYRRMLRDPQIDAVAILLPHHLHAPVIRDVLTSQKHVICEKPLVTDPKEIDGIRRMSERFGKYVYLKQYFRFSALHREAMSLLLDGEIGAPYLVTCLYSVNAKDEFRNPKSWRFKHAEAGGGVFMDVGIHMLDFLQEVFGQPVSVTSTMRKFTHDLTEKGEDVCVVTYVYGGGLIVNIVCTAADSSYGFRWEKHFFGTDGSMHLEDSGKARMNLIIRTENRVRIRKHESFWWERANTDAINDIIGRIRRGEMPAISLEDADMTLRSLIGAYESETRRMVIRLGQHA